MAFTSEALVTIHRGSVPESEHRGSVAVVDGNGHLIAFLGDPDLIIPLRSTAKPFQLLPLVESGGSSHYAFSPEELAIMAGSHSGSQRHLGVVKQLMKKAGLEEFHLQCGSHLPFDSAEADALKRAGQSPTVLHNNCSGKHAGMVALTNFLDKTIDDYCDPSHPVQTLIRQSMAELTNTPIDKITTMVDGCSAPTFAVSLQGLARAFAHLSTPPSETPPPPLPYSTSEKQAYQVRDHLVRQRALSTIAQAMIKAPEMVAGQGRLDTELMVQGEGAVVAKSGAEGVQGIGILKTQSLSRFKAPIGIAIKISDGEGRRSLKPTAIEVLRQLNVLPAAFFEKIKKFDDRSITNHKGLKVGEVTTEFQLRWV